jgi:hypothetical protein
MGPGDCTGPRQLVGGEAASAKHEADETASRAGTPAPAPAATRRWPWRYEWRGAATNG